MDNSKLWIIIIIAIIAFTIIAVCEIWCVYLILLNCDSNIWLKVILKGALITVPIQMGLGIQYVIKRITYKK